MKLGWKAIIFGALLSVAPASGQMAEDVFKNVQVLKGISVSEFMGTMGFFSASLSLNCTDCHISESSGDWARYADDTPLKRTARRMVVMVNNINKNNFGGRRAVTCYSCHRGTIFPKVIPNLADQYGTPPPDDPNEVEIAGQAPATVSADPIFDKYIQALGGAERLANLTSFAAKGTYQGYDTDLEAVPFDVFAKAPGQRTATIHLRIGDSITTYDGRAGWIAAPDKPVRLLTLAGQDLDGVKLEAALSFPAGLKQSLSQLHAGFPKASIGDREVQIVQGAAAGGSRVKLFFDKQSGLLVRTVRYTVTAVGIIPAQSDYSDYRDVAGVKIPFHWVATWTDGQSTVELSEVQPNVAMDASKFAKPAPAPPPKSALK
ncbi:MAG TPA: photosynthetic reaction center cytochrome c subunit family protein [Bryobacteraceae bacterium]|nr:photosynthetic reaction center cytochrome c subunit family protein [Bryobacteraceae bacterium]